MTTPLDRAGEEAVNGPGDPEPKRAAAPRYAKAPSTAAVIGWTGLSALVPGAAHLRAGRRRTGFLLLGAFGAILVAAIAFALIVRANLGLALKDSTLVVVTVVAAVGALAWFALVLTSYVALRPDRLPQSGQVVSGVVVGVLCVTVMAPFALTASSIVTVRQTANAVFPSDGGAGASIAPVRQEDPWNGRRRVNFLLIGGDAAGNRTGVRTDSMTVASVDVGTGNAVMFSLPRNLQYVHFPKGDPLAARFPNGFTGDSGQGLLNEVWQYAEDHLGKGKGPQELKNAIGHTLGFKIDYYAIVDMYGFAALIDAVGGLRIRVEQDIKWGGHFGTAGTIKAGYQLLDGEHVLWYGRSRVDSDDFSRMSRQRCVMGALLAQATPSVVLANFGKIASATRHMFRTDIPRDLLEHLVPLALKVKDAKTTSLQFVPPTIWPGAADWVKIRRLTAKALKESEQSRRPTLAAGATPGARPSGATPATSPSGAENATPSPTRSRASAPATPLRTPTPNDQASAKTLADACGF
ncbi:LCP family protein [Sphaerisporangium krabiense]|uniref:LCP family protein required for cell wall assembly n=1 Tax=Sphaerisporangium krabiense TaxID=763782 RepID=A0A7W8Z965_9ACTN|nr:LCP family protein [Sphaerisporangium krabiense]MBB5629804.1 LCP family protein required for cell wall assembly [Sphaerisporangium krabiense]